MMPALTDFSISSYSSSILPMHISSPSSDRQIGKGVPQKRLRERFQSFKLSSQLPKRPVPVDSGCQLIVLFNSDIRSLHAEDLMNQESRG